MADYLFLLAAGLSAAGAVVTLAVVARRLQLARKGRRDERLMRRLRPLALEIVEEGHMPMEQITAMNGKEREALARLVGTYSRWIKGDARRSVGNFFERSGLLAPEFRALHSLRARRRIAAAHALGDMGSPRGVGPLREALGDGDRDVRAAAVRSLGRLGDREAVQPIIDTLLSGRVPLALAGEALMEIGSAAVPALRELVTVPDSQVRVIAVRLLGHVGSVTDAPLVATRLHDPSADVRARACASLARIGGPGQLEGMRNALHDRVPYVRVHAAHGLGTVGEPADVSSLLRMGSTDSFDVARAAAAAATAIAPAAVTEAALEPAAGDHIREAASTISLSRV